MSTLERIRHELREIGLVTLYFLACFLVFLSLKKLLLVQYDIQVTVLGKAVVGALVVAKVVVLLEKTRLGERLRPGRLVLHVLARTLLYTAAVFLVTLVERGIDQYRELGSLSATVTALWTTRDPTHFLAMNVAVGLTLLVYNTFSEIDAYLGDGGLRRLFLDRRRPAPRGADST